MRRVIILGNGILNFPGSAHGWTDRGVTWIHRNTDHRAEKFEYFAGPLSRRIWQQGHADDMAALIRQYRGWEIVVAVHSNGADLLCRALRNLPDMTIHEAHLISPACEADFRANGLNEALESGRVGTAVVYVAGRDKAMWLARASRAVFGFLGLGYGDLGRVGAVGVSDAAKKHLGRVDEPEFGHCDWFEPDEFDFTMRRIVG